MERSLDNRYIFLERISNHLIVNASSLNDLGLYHGKIGVCLFFAHYSRFTGCTLYDDFASELMDEVYKDIHNGLTFKLKNDYCGVDWIHICNIYCKIINRLFMNFILQDNHIHF